MNITEARRILAALRTGQPLIDRHKAARALEWALMQAYMLPLPIDLSPVDFSKMTTARLPAQASCWCNACQRTGFISTDFIVCPICGNKRCPKAAYHGNVCTGSNEPGQLPAPPGDDDGRSSAAPDR